MLSTSFSAVLPYVLEYLDLDEIVRVACCSSALFYAVQQNKYFWSHLNFSRPDLCREGQTLLDLAKSSLSKRGALISSLIFPFCYHFNDLILQQFFHIVSEQSHETEKCSVELINFNGCRGITDAGLLCLARYCNMLQRLSLYSNVNVTDKGLVPLVKACREVLLLLNVSGCRRIGDVSLKALAGSPSTSLRHLDLTRTSGISDFGIHIICNGLLKLQELILYACNHLSAGAFKYLMNLKYLERLDLCGCNIVDSDVKQIFLSCPRLRHVNLTWCTRLSDQSLFSIAQSSPQYIQDETPVDAGLFCLSLHGLKAMTPLGLQALISSHHRLTLTALDIRGCVHLFSQYINNDFYGLKKAFPNLKAFQLHS